MKNAAARTEPDYTGHNEKYIKFWPKNKNRPVFKKKKKTMSMDKNKKPDSSDPQCRHDVLVVTLFFRSSSHLVVLLIFFFFAHSPKSQTSSLFSISYFILWLWMVDSSKSFLNFILLEDLFCWRTCLAFMAFKLEVWVVCL